MKYQVTIKKYANSFTEPAHPRFGTAENHEETGDYFNTKREVVRFIALEMGVTQTSIRREIEARVNAQTIYRDNLGWRAEILWDDGTWS